MHADCANVSLRVELSHWLFLFYSSPTDRLVSVNMAYMQCMYNVGVSEYLQVPYVGFCFPLQHQVIQLEVTDCETVTSIWKEVDLVLTHIYQLCRDKEQVETEVHIGVYIILDTEILLYFQPVSDFN